MLVERQEAIRACADYAAVHGYVAFAVFDKGQCLTGPDAHNTFSQGGASRDCDFKGTGATTASNVYSFNTGICYISSNVSEMFKLQPHFISILNLIGIQVYLYASPCQIIKKIVCFQILILYILCFGGKVTFLSIYKYLKCVA